MRSNPSLLRSHRIAPLINHFELFVFPCARPDEGWQAGRAKPKKHSADFRASRNAVMAYMLRSLTIQNARITPLKSSTAAAISERMHGAHTALHMRHRTLPVHHTPVCWSTRHNFSFAAVFKWVRPGRRIQIRVCSCAVKGEFIHATHLTLHILA